MAKRIYRNVQDLIALIQRSESESEDDVHDADDVESVVDCITLLLLIVRVIQPENVSNFVIEYLLKALKRGQN